MGALSHLHGHADEQPGRSPDDIPERLGNEVIPPKRAAHPTSKDRLRTALIVVAITVVITILLTIVISLQQPIR